MRYDIMTKNKRPSFEDFKNKALKDPEFKADYESLELVATGLKQAKEGKGKPLIIDLDDDREWLSNWGKDDTDLANDYEAYLGVSLDDWEMLMKMLKENKE